MKWHADAQDYVKLYTEKNSRHFTQTLNYAVLYCMLCISVCVCVCALAYLTVHVGAHECITTFMCACVRRKEAHFSCPS